MLPQHGGVPNFSMRIRGPILVLLLLVLIIGSLLTLSFYLQGRDGGLGANNLATLSFIITLLLSFFILLAGTGRWWHRHLWKRGNSQKHHRRRIQKNKAHRRHRH